MVKLLVATHESAMLHDAGHGHPERPDRVPAVLRGLTSSGLPVDLVEPEPASTNLLTLVHSADYVKQMERFLASGGGRIDMDTAAVAESWDAALRAAAAGPDLARRLSSQEGDLGFVVMRPPGHHAVADQAMGFCLFNNVAVTAAQLADDGYRVAIVDWDVHHGNGTQDIFYAEPSVLYISIHQDGIYPGTGHHMETGSGVAEGTNLNIGVPGRTGGAFHRRAVAQIVVPVIEQFQPDWLLVSAGYDAHAADPLATLQLLDDDLRGHGSNARQGHTCRSVDRLSRGRL